MEVIRRLRFQAGVTQQELASKAGTSQPTIALYESGAKSPTFSTLKKLAASVDLDLIIHFTPKLTREDQRSLAYHQAIAKKIQKNPEITIERARNTLKRMSQKNPYAKALFNKWKQWLTLSVEELIQRILDPGIEARNMRQVSPFAGLLSPKERMQILKRFRKEYQL
ncbi:MAG: helix-turn-helix transcriptional regulator [bacterium]|nr:helix-turn-helix transcriptional regulator [bacterium]MBU1918192.1 helix-turn-helix transcriptional regulator [bacterium]